MGNILEIFGDVHLIDSYIGGKLHQIEKMAIIVFFFFYHFPLSCYIM